QKTLFLGYSNGANMLAAMMQLHPALVRKAVLLRAIKVLEEALSPDLRGVDILSLTGDRDLFGSLAPQLEDELRLAGARLVAERVAAGHEAGTGDIKAIQSWLRDLERQSDGALETGTGRI
ncbi:MAG: alpha/beta hydrolase, partial [Phyllobacterium sp.]